MMTLREKYRYLRHVLEFYAYEGNYDLGNSKSIKTDRGQRAREILEITDGPEAPEEE